MLDQRDSIFLKNDFFLNINHLIQYGVVFDAGSSHTDVTVYQWPSQHKDHGTARTKEMIFTNCSGEDSQEKAKMLRKLLELFFYLDINQSQENWLNLILFR